MISTTMRAMMISTVVEIPVVPFLHRVPFQVEGNYTHVVHDESEHTHVDRKEHFVHDKANYEAGDGHEIH